MSQHYFVLISSFYFYSGQLRNQTIISIDQNSVIVIIFKSISLNQAMDIQVDSGEKRRAQNRVKVAIRVRPMLSRQISTQEQSCFEYLSKNEIVIGNERSFKFDNVFKQSSTQEEVYEQSIRDLMLGCFEGYNAAVLAYGQTGSGKTFTMGTNITNLDCHEQGIIPRVINDIFTEIEKRKNISEFTVKASFIEIYNEQIIDLLENHKSLKSKDNGAISIRQEKDGSVTLSGVTEQSVIDSSQMLAMLERGSMNRTTAATMMNDASSRSHAIFTINIEQRLLTEIDQGYIVAKLFFVDLAGSERLKKTGATGTTLKEGISINLGLLELGNVISALAIQKKQLQFITYRNSKLTRILQDSLGGNSNTYMIACVSPAESNYEESLNTLKYASKAMNIKNKPIVNRDPHTALVNQLRQQIQQLETENKKLKQLLKGSGIQFQNIISPKSMSEDDKMKKIGIEMNILSRKNELFLLQLKDQKKRKNQLQIQNYDLQRQKDILLSLVEQFKNNHPQFQLQVDELQSKQNIPLIENYLNNIQKLQSQLFQKDKIINQLQIQYTKIHQSCQKDEQILIKKNEGIHKLLKENKDLKRVINQLKKQIYQANHIQQFQEEQEEDQLSVIQEVTEQDNLQLDQSFNKHVTAFSQRQEKMQTQIKSVEDFICEKEGILKQMAQQQMELQLKLVLEMKEKYYQKIGQIQKEKNMLLKQQRSENNVQNTNKLSQKIGALQLELKEYRAKIQSQKQLQNKVTQQSNMIKSLGTEIKNFKIQKIELNRKLKEDKDHFQKFKQKRTQELLFAKKENAKKDIQIRKLTNQNKKKSMNVLKKGDQLKKIKKINETLKRLMKPVKMMTRSSTNSLKNDKMDIKESIIQGNEIQSLVSNCLECLLLKIDKGFDLAKYSKKCQEINSQLDVLVRDQSSLSLKLQKLQIMDNEQDEINLDRQIQKENEKNKMQLNIQEMRERISTLQANLQFCQRKYYQIFSDQNPKYNFNYEAQIIYNPLYDNINTFRQILKAFIETLHKVLVQNYQIKVCLEQMNIKNNALTIEIEQLRDNIVKMSIQHQQSISQLRDELILKQYELANQDDSIEKDLSKGDNHFVQTNNQKNQGKEKKILQKKVLQLTKNVSRLNLDIETWRRKCVVISEKYHSMKALFNKDKFIGRPNREEQNNINHPNNQNQRQLKKTTYNPPTGYPVKLASQNSNMMQELNNMANQLNSARAKKMANFSEERAMSDDFKEQLTLSNRRQYNRYKWQCIATIEAHSSPVLCLKSFRNLIISSASRNIRIWDLNDNKLVSDIVSPNLSTFVKSLAVSTEKKLLAAACEKQVTLWDLRQSSNEGVLKGHKEEVRCLHIANNYLFTAGKGLSNSGSLLVWDMRFMNFAHPLEQKERNQDIFSMTSHKNILYYGSRDHHVRRLNIDTLQTLTTFQPPHMDTVTGLAISKGYLISGSKDKNLRLWALDNSIYNLKSTVHASNDYINTVQSDLYHPLFYAGDRTGQVKVGTIIKQKIQFIGGFSHSQSVNSICSLQMGRAIATASADKSIKLWQPTQDTFLQIQDLLC